MNIERENLKGALDAAAARTPWISEYRKTSTGRVVRFVDWRKTRRAAR